MNKAYLGIGTNMGERLKNLLTACDILQRSENINISKKSKIYETKAWGYKEQDDFLNMCVEVETTLDPMELLKVCQSIEKVLHRERIIRWGPRTIDVDILLYSNIKLDTEELKIPHPRISQRAFVLIPLKDLDEKILIENKNIQEYLDDLSQKEIEEVKEFTI